MPSLLLLANCAWIFTAAELPKPNILFILADDLGIGDLSCYGQKRFRTPNLDRLAAAGCRFTAVYAGSTVCAPSRCSLMTGKHTGHSTIRGNAAIPLKPDDLTVADDGNALDPIARQCLGDLAQCRVIAHRHDRARGRPTAIWSSTTIRCCSSAGKSSRASARSRRRACRYTHTS